ncbi:MAG: MarR family winged helix-turn-helix transcriptional regulator [Actinomycetota bacterium]
MTDDEASAAMVRTVKRARATLVEAVAVRLRDGGGTGLRAAHIQVFEHLDREGTRLTQLAERAEISHQAMGELVTELVTGGYLERVPDPADGRARLVRPTAKGLTELGRASRVLGDICDQWQQDIGAAGAAQVLRGLESLIRICDAGRQHSPAVQAAP